MTIDEILALIDRKSETPHWDHKAGFKWSRENRDHQLELIRDMMAMANIRDGGVIVLGVENKTYNLVGLSSEILESLDQTKIGEVLNGYTDSPITFELQKAPARGVEIAVIHVPEFMDVPIICKKSVQGSDQNLILRQGAIYTRTEAAQTSEISSAEDMRRLLRLALAKLKEEMLHSIRQIMEVRANTAPDSNDHQFDQELVETDKWFREVLGKGFLNSPRWEVVARPVQYRIDRALEL